MTEQNSSREHRPTDGHNEAGEGDLRQRVFVLIFQSNTPAGKVFDLVLILAIAISIVTIMLESVASIGTRYGFFLRGFEWMFTLLFTVEYLVRLWCVRRARVYATSFYGIVDLLAVLPTYLALIVTGSGYLLVIRILRILRLFRVLKLARYVSAADSLFEAMLQSWRKILVFLYVVVTIVIVFGALMFIVEGPANGFTSMPRSVYWGIVTLTTVGFGDIVPQTALGQFIASIVMIMGYGIIAVPTGIYAAELRDVMTRRRSANTCPECSRSGHDEDAVFCRFCGARMQQAG
ncbi:MAG TPA: ion transporter [Woeseiaceae bacterium]|nr:ion transporter [Woeseiaceae bacterium]